MKKLLLSLFALPLLAQELPEPSCDFNYLSVGTLIIPDNPRFLLEVIPDLYIGHRQFLSPHRALDYGIGADIHYYLQTLYGQFSYLHYFHPHQGAYLGIGVTLGAFHTGKSNQLEPSLFHLTGPLANIPITIGYQFQQNRFLQLQLTPFLTSTLSYGFGF